MTKEELKFSVDLGIEYLFNCIKADGSFIYEIHSKTGVISNTYNILRHGGTLFLLYQSLKPSINPKLSDLLESPTHFLLNHIFKLKSHNEMMCVVEKNEAKLGGSALALLALTERFKIKPSSTDLETMASLANFLLWMQEDTGKFISKLFFDKSIFSDFVSVYYPGEAILALLRFYKIDSNPLWLKGAEKGAHFLIKHPVKNKNLTYGHNHWLAIALSELYMITKQKVYYDEVWRITKGTVNSMNENYRSNNSNYNYSSCAMATRGETIMAALKLDLFTNKYDQIPWLIHEFENVANFCWKFQIKKDKIFNNLNLKGGIKAGEGKGKIRIDYNQHFMQILIQILDLDLKIVQLNGLVAEYL